MFGAQTNQTPFGSNHNSTGWSCWENNHLEQFAADPKLSIQANNFRIMLQFHELAQDLTEAQNARQRTPSKHFIEHLQGVLKISDFGYGWVPNMHPWLCSFRFAIRVCRLPGSRFAIRGCRLGMKRGYVIVQRNIKLGVKVFPIIFNIYEFNLKPLMGPAITSRVVNCEVHFRLRYYYCYLPINSISYPPVTFKYNKYMCFRTTKLDGLVPVALFHY